MNRTLTIIAILLGILFVIAGVVYSTHTAGILPHYFPGYEAAGDKIHVKHALAAFVLGAACFIYAWFQTGPKDGRIRTNPES